MDPSGNEKPVSARSKRSLRTRIFALHGWIGVHLGALLLVICLSGVVAVFSHEVDWLFTKAKRTESAWPGNPIPLDKIVKAARENYPGIDFVWLEFPRRDGWAMELTGYKGTHEHIGNLQRVYADPADGTITGIAGWYNFQRVLRNFHMSLFTMPGFYLVTVFGFVLLASGITGMVLHPRWWRSLFNLRFGRSKRLLWSHLHRVAGGWTLLFALVIGLTGVWYFAEAVIWDVDEKWGEQLEPPGPIIESLPPGGELIGSIDAAVKAAQEAHPELVITMIRLPLAPNEPLYLEGLDGSLLVTPRAAQVYVNLFDSSVVEVRRVADLTPLQRWVHTADPLHFGTFGGMTTRVLWAVLGLILSFGILSGGIIWLLRGASKDRWFAAGSAVVLTMLLLAFTLQQAVSDMMDVPK